MGSKPLWTSYTKLSSLQLGRVITSPWPSSNVERRIPPLTKNLLSLLNPLLILQLVKAPGSQISLFSVQSILSGQLAKVIHGQDELPYIVNKD